jgi:hypothetical protein
VESGGGWGGTDGVGGWEVEGVEGGRVGGGVVHAWPGFTSDLLHEW